MILVITGLMVAILLTSTFSADDSYWKWTEKNPKPSWCPWGKDYWPEEPVRGGLTGSMVSIPGMAISAKAFKADAAIVETRKLTTKVKNALKKVKKAQKKVNKANTAFAGIEPLNHYRLQKKCGWI